MAFVFELVVLVWVALVPFVGVWGLWVALELVREWNREAFDEGACEAFERVEGALRGLGPRPGVAEAVYRVERVREGFEGGGG